MPKSFIDYDLVNNTTIYTHVVPDLSQIKQCKKMSTAFIFANLQMKTQKPSVIHPIEEVLLYTDFIWINSVSTF